MEPKQKRHHRKYQFLVSTGLVSGAVLTAAGIVDHYVVITVELLVGMFWV